MIPRYTIRWNFLDNSQDIVQEFRAISVIFKHFSLDFFIVWKIFEYLEMTHGIKMVLK